MSQNCRQKSEADPCLSIVTVILHAGRVQHWSFPGNLVTGAIREDNICKVRTLCSPAHPAPAGDSLACLPAWWGPFCWSEGSRWCQSSCQHTSSTPALPFNLVPWDQVSQLMAQHHHPITFKGWCGTGQAIQKDSRCTDHSSQSSSPCGDFQSDQTRL